MSRSLAWLAAAPLMLVGSQLAHAIAYRIVFPQAHARVLYLLATGHAYTRWLPIALAVAGACVLVSLSATVFDSVRGRETRALPAPAFALLPPLAFALQETLELSLHTGTFAWRAVLAPTFVPGLLLQLPVALVTYLVARLLLRAAVRLGRALAASPALRRSPQATPARSSLHRRLPTGRRLARAPPRVVLL
jgi:hypothetical protein